MSPWRALSVLKGRGPLYAVYLLTGYLAPKILWRLLAMATPRRAAAASAALLLAAGFLIGVAWGPAEAVSSVVVVAAAAGIVLFAAERRRRTQVTSQAKAAGRDLPVGALGWESWPVPSATRSVVERAVERALSCGRQRELVLGRIELDGLLATDFGSFPGFDVVPAAAFRPRDRFDLDLVLLDGRPAVRKGFRGDRGCFTREIQALSQLAGHARVPHLVRVDRDRLILYRTLVPGRPLNDVLVANGALLREAQLDSDVGLAPLSAAERLAAVLARGRELLGTALPESFFRSLEDQIDCIHRRGVTGMSLTFGNLTVEGEDRRPWLFDFDGARVHRSKRSLRFEVHRDRDRHKYNEIYGRSAMTRQQAEHLLVRWDGYSPVDLGLGLASGGFWSIDSGTGRWDFLNGRALEGHLAESRILDLGSHNGAMSLLMLRSGAREVVAYEQDPQRVEAARDLQRLFEWRDLTRYSLDLRCDDMRAVLGEDLGRFDLVTAFCSLYYLAEEDMARVVRRAAELAPRMVLQAKTDTRREAAGDKARKSSIGFLEQLLRDNGFPEVRIVAPRGYSRPLLFGERRTRELE